MSVVVHIGATVYFAEPLKGRVVVGLVRQITAEHGPTFVEAQDPTHPELVLSGQFSNLAHGNLRVVDPNDTSRGLDPDAEYTRVFVASQIWEGTVVSLEGSDKDKLDVVKQFCAGLDNAALRVANSL